MTEQDKIAVLRCLKRSPKPQQLYDVVSSMFKVKYKGGVEKPQIIVERTWMIDEFLLVCADGLDYVQEFVSFAWVW